MLDYDPLRLPSSTELPDSADIPVDNEFQNLIPNLLLMLLTQVWHDRDDWYFGVDMGIYHTTGRNPRIPLIPDGFLSIGVQRYKGDRGRLSYVLWEENYVTPILILEAVSQTYSGEYGIKKTKYARLGALYYVIYNPDYSKRDKHDPLEVYRLEAGSYIRQWGDPVWLPELQLGIGRGHGIYAGWEREWLYWFDQNGDRFFTAEELVTQERTRAEQERIRAEQERTRAEQERTRAEQERTRAERLAERLRQLNIDPDAL
jgi:Uma2 family endonuclease